MGKKCGCGIGFSTAAGACVGVEVMTRLASSLLGLVVLAACVLQSTALCAGPVLTGGQRRQLRAHAGRLAAAKALRYVNVGDIERSHEEVDLQLSKCELLRCKFAVLKKAEAKELAHQMAERTGSTVAEVLGHTALLYRPSKQKLIKLDS